MNSVFRPHRDCHSDADDTPLPYNRTPNMTAVPRAKANGAHASEAETENLRWRVRKWIVKKGISIMCPNSSLSTNVAADIPLFRAGMRLAYLLKRSPRWPSAISSRAADLATTLSAMSATWPHFLSIIQAPIGQN
jgi:hypothetical protein